MNSNEKAEKINRKLRRQLWGVRIGGFIIIFLLVWTAILDEIVYYKTTKYSDYTIQIELLTGSITTIYVTEPTNIHFQINCHSHKGTFNGCNLEVVPKRGIIIPGGHWRRIRDGVINFKILEKHEHR